MKCVLFGGLWAILKQDQVSHMTQKEEPLEDKSSAFAN